MRRLTLGAEQAHDPLADVRAARARSRAAAHDSASKPGMVSSRLPTISTISAPGTT